MTFSVHKRAWRNGHVGINFLSNPSKESQSLLNDVISCQIFLIVVADDLNHSKEQLFIRPTCRAIVFIMADFREKTMLRKTEVLFFILNISAHLLQENG